MSLPVKAPAMHHLFRDRRPLQLSSGSQKVRWGLYTNPNRSKSQGKPLGGFEQKLLGVNALYLVVSSNWMCYSAKTLLEEVGDREGSQFEMMLDRALSLKR